MLVANVLDPNVQATLIVQQRPNGLNAFSLVKGKTYCIFFDHPPIISIVSQRGHNFTDMKKNAPPLVPYFFVVNFSQSTVVRHYFW